MVLVHSFSGGPLPLSVETRTHGLLSGRVEQSLGSLPLRRTAV